MDASDDVHTHGCRKRTEQFDKRPAFDLMLLQEPAALDKFKRAVEAFEERVTKGS